MSYVRYIHFVAGYILAVALILKIYGFIINRGDRLFPRPWTKLYWTGIVDLLKHYTFLQAGHKPYLRNSMARTSYVFVYLMILVQVITGFAMYYAIDPNRTLAKMFMWFGDEYMLHIIHHIVTWVLILFAIVHVYLAIRADFMEIDGEISSMFSGVKYMHDEPADIEDLVEPEQPKEILPILSRRF
jgi:Ni/Fe-hydrogenase 1 B-type cytochrome subunit